MCSAEMIRKWRNTIAALASLDSMKSAQELGE